MKANRLYNKYCMQNLYKNSSFRKRNVDNIILSKVNKIAQRQKNIINNMNKLINSEINGLIEEKEKNREDINCLTLHITTMREETDKKLKQIDDLKKEKNRDIILCVGIFFAYLIFIKLMLMSYLLD